MKRLALLAILAGCTTTKPPENCVSIPSLHDDIQACVLPLNTLCFTYRDGISCTRPLITKGT